MKWCPGKHQRAQNFRESLSSEREVNVATCKDHLGEIKFLPFSKAAQSQEEKIQLRHLGLLGRVILFSGALLGSNHFRQRLRRCLARHGAPRGRWVKEGEMVSTLVQEGFRLAGKAHETNMSQVRTLREKPRVLALQGMHACVCVYMWVYVQGCTQGRGGGP